MTQAELKSQIEEVKQNLQAEKDAAMIKKCNTALMFPSTGLSLRSTEGGGIAITGAPHAELFTPERAEELSQKVTNGNKEAPEPVSAKKFYQRLLDMLQGALIDREKAGI